MSGFAGLLVIVGSCMWITGTRRLWHTDRHWSRLHWVGLGFITVGFFIQGTLVHG